MTKAGRDRRVELRALRYADKLCRRILAGVPANSDGDRVMVSIDPASFVFPAVELTYQAPADFV